MITLRDYLHEIEAYLEQNLTDQAIAHASHILKQYPNSVNALRYLGQSYLESKKYSDASECFLKVLSIIPDDFVSHVGLSAIKEDERDIDSSIYHMELAYDTQPSNLIVQDELKRLIGRRDGMAPQKINLSRGALIRMYIKGELYQQAINEIDATLSSNPERIDQKVLLASILFQSNSKVQSADTCNQILEQLPYCYEANRLLHEIYLENGLLENAKSVRERLTSVDPYFAWVISQGMRVEDVPNKNVELEKLDYTSAFTVGQVGNNEFWSPPLEQKMAENNLESILPKETSDIENSSIFSEIFSNDSKASIENPEVPPPLDQGKNESMDVNSTEDLVPDFMKEAGWQRSSGSQESSPDYSETENNENAEKTELPDWLKSYNPEKIEKPAVESKTTEIIDQKSDLFNKVDAISSDNQTDNLSSSEISQSSNEVTMPTENPLPNNEKDDSSDWMAQFFDEAKNSQQNPDGEKELPDWLKSFDQEDVAKEPVPGEDLSDWLKNLDSEIINKSTEVKIPDDENASNVNSDQPWAVLKTETADISIPDFTEEEQNDLIQDIPDLSSRLDFISSVKTPSQSENNNTESIPEDFDSNVKDTIPVNEIESSVQDLSDSDSQVPDWVKSVLNEPDTESSAFESSEIIPPIEETTPPLETNLPTESEFETEAVSEGAISDATADELLDWLHEISPEVSDNLKSDTTSKEEEFTTSQPAYISIDRSTAFTSEEMPVSDVLAQENPLEQVAEPLVEYISSNDLNTSVDIIRNEETPSQPVEIMENIPGEPEPETDFLSTLHDNVEKENYDDALSQISAMDLTQVNSENLLEKVLPFEADRKASFEYLQFLGDVYAKFDKFDDALATYSLAEDLLLKK